MVKKDAFNKLSLIISYIIFGSVGIFVRYIPLSSVVIAAVRGLVGAGFIFAYKIFLKSPVDRDGIRKNLLLLLISGSAIGFNWIFLFESYRYTTIASATLCYYMAPVFVTLAAPFILKESFSLKKGIGVVVAVVGMALASGLSNLKGTSLKGAVFGLMAAALYAAAIICNRRMGKIEASDRAMLQLGIAGAIVVPYVIFSENALSVKIGAVGIALLLTVSLVHTGLAYVLNLGAVGRIPAQSVAVLSFIDPITAIIAAALIFGEIPDIFGIIGTALVLFGALIGEVRVK